MRRPPPVALVLLAIASVQVGSSLAKGLFGVVPPIVAAWLRNIFGAAIVWAVTRPSIRGHSWSQWRVAVAYGAALAGMNAVFYLSLQRIPVGMAVTFEFLGPLAVAVLGSTRRLDVVWAGLAGLGVLLLGFSPEPLDPVGVGFALAAGACWALYILVTPAVTKRWEGTAGLGVGLLVGVGMLTPVAAAQTAVTGSGWAANPEVWFLGLVLGLLSTALPYGLEMRALRTMPRPTFGTLMSLEPAAAALAALILLGEALSGVEWAAMGLVITASIGVVKR